ncbi:MAG: hypothetical protein GPOALKHO_001397 [Sodalis sp.]|nr:MAG: hypothetical protein GPOALKHO_001397 [Sodalis sp.]
MSVLAAAQLHRKVPERVLGLGSPTSTSPVDSVEPDAYSPQPVPFSRINHAAPGRASTLLFGRC